ncbi:MAG TPA: hypothetical protein VG916_08475 [Gemmatimonadaceae bacterium]|nr:hypothetical protein [Gemmatimonadaceae bacterium]
MRPPPTVVAAAAVAVACAAITARAQDVPLGPVHERGQTVTPAFEGWYRNPDGTISLSFGYFNRNAAETLEIPAGPDNYFSPGPPDRGQPQVFYPRRNWGVFTIVVPGDTKPTEKFVWTLVVRGDTLRVPGHVRPQWQIDALEGEAGSNNTPPVLRFAEGGPGGAGPGGITAGPVRAKVGQPVELRAWATDDGNVRNSVASGGRQGVPVTLRWFKHSGPGAVTFAPPAPRPAPGTGLATTTATFSAPGEYVVRLRANDASGVVAGGHSQCCWTNGFVRVTVAP